MMGHLPVRTGSPELDAWIWVTVHKDPEFKSVVWAIRKYRGDDTLSQQPQKNFLWDLMQKDFKANGRVCIMCLDRGEFETQYLKICDACFGKAISGLESANELSSKGVGHFVYSLYSDYEDKFSYIGVTKNPKARYQDHYLEKPIYRMVLHHGFKERRAAEEFETLQIALHRPPLNKAVPEINSIGHLVEKFSHIRNLTV